MPAFTTLISVEQLAEQLGQPNLVIIDCRFSLAHPSDGKRRYLEDHIPGAQYAHMDDDLSSAITTESGRHPLPDPNRLVKQFSEWGVDSSSQIVVYDDMAGAMAGRLWWLARWLGHKNVALLDGGYALWQAEDYPTESDVKKPLRKQFVAHVDNSILVSANEVEEGLRDKSILLVDARASERFRGEVEPLDSVAGHVPGALNRPLQTNLASDKTFKKPEDLHKEFAVLFAGQDAKRVVHMCGSGVTACHNMLAMELAGMSGSRLYAGSWSEWIRDPSRPVVKD